MSGDEGQDVELRELVAQTLENNGVLPKIRAELRASVFLALEDQDGATKSQFANKPLKEFVSTVEGSLILSLVKELLEYFELDNTLSVFDPETKHGSDYVFREREQLIKDLKINNLNGRKGPLLAQILQLAQSHNADEASASNTLQNQFENNSEMIKQRSTNKEKPTVQKSTIIPNYTQEDGKNSIIRNGNILGILERDQIPPKLEPIKLSSGSSSLLGDLPPLSKAAVIRPVQQAKEQDLQELSKDMLDLELHSPENYDEDFHSSGSGSPQDEPSKATPSEIEEVVSTVDDPLSSHQSDLEEGAVDPSSSHSHGMNQANHIDDI